MGSSDLLIPLIIIAGVVGYVKRCDWFKICGDSSSTPPPAPPAAATPPAPIPSASDTSGLSPDLVKMATTGPGASSRKHVTKHKKIAVKRGKRGTRTVVPVSSSSSGGNSDHLGCLSGAIPATDPRCASSAFTRISI